MIHNKLELIRKDIEEEIGKFNIIASGFVRCYPRLLIGVKGCHYLVTMTGSTVDTQRLMIESATIVSKNFKHENEYINSIRVCKRCKGVGEDPISRKIKRKNSVWASPPKNCIKCGGYGWVDWIEEITGKPKSIEEVKNKNMIDNYDIIRLIKDKNNKAVILVVDKGGFML